MAFLEKKDNAKSLITNNPLTSGGLSISVTTSEGAKFPATGQFVVTLWDNSTYSDPGDDPTMEKILCDSISGDTIIVNASGRGYDGTSGVAHAQGSRIALLNIALHFGEIEDAVNINPLSAKISLVDADEFKLYDSIASTLKKITWSSLKAILNALYVTIDGWTDATDAWTFTSWDSSVRTGVIATASDESGHIQLGDRITISQSTGGTKYAIVTAITSSAITLFMYDTDVLENEAITSPQFSHQKNPLGFDSSVDKWTVEVVNIDNNTQSSPVTDTLYNPGSVQIEIPIGKWDLSYDAFSVFVSTSSTVNVRTALSTSTSSITNTRLVDKIFNDMPGTTTPTISESHFAQAFVTHASATIYYLLIVAEIASSVIRLNGSVKPIIIQARCAYI